MLDGKYFQRSDETARRRTRRRGEADAVASLCTSARRPRHELLRRPPPSFAGNVVKAMASAKQGYSVVSPACWRSAPRRSRIDACALDGHVGVAARARLLSSTSFDWIAAANVDVRRAEDGVLATCPADVFCDAGASHRSGPSTIIDSSDDEGCFAACLERRCPPHHS